MNDSESQGIVLTKPPLSETDPVIPALLSKIYE